MVQFDVGSACANSTAIWRLPELARLLPNKNSISGMVFDANPTASNWGGARNKGISTVLSLSKARTIIALASKADEKGLSLNRHVTVHWGALGLSDHDAAWASGRLIKLATDWLRTQGVAPMWLWVRENDNGDGSKGPHVHILLHCPHSVHIGRMWRRWLRNITGKPYRRRGVHTARIGGTVNCYQTAPALYQLNLANVLAYICKGVAPADALTLGIVHTPGGTIIGKRAAWRQGYVKIAGPIPVVPS
jgi:hypothetical protein